MITVTYRYYNIHHQRSPSKIRHMTFFIVTGLSLGWIDIVQMLQTKQIASNTTSFHRRAVSFSQAILCKLDINHYLPKRVTAQHLHCLISQPLNLLCHSLRRQIDNQPVPCPAQAIRLPQRRNVVSYLQLHSLPTPAPNGWVDHHPAEFRGLDCGNHILVEHP